MVGDLERLRELVLHSVRPVPSVSTCRRSGCEACFEPALFLLAAFLLPAPFPPACFEGLPFPEASLEALPFPAACFEASLRPTLPFDDPSAFCRQPCPHRPAWPNLAGRHPPLERLTCRRGSDRRNAGPRSRLDTVPIRGGRDCGSKRCSQC
jgi:hypothetical protein